MLAQDNNVNFQSEYSFKETEVGSIAADFEKKLYAAKHALELLQLTEAKFEAKGCQRKVEELELS